MTGCRVMGWEIEVGVVVSEMLVLLGFATRVATESINTKMMVMASLTTQFLMQRYSFH